MSESCENRILEQWGGEEVTSNTVHFMTFRNCPIVMDLAFATFDRYETVKLCQQD